MTASATQPGVRSSTLEGLAFLARTRGWLFALWAAMAVWTIVLFAVVRNAYTGFRLGRYDLGNMVQAVWNTAEGRPLEWTSGDSGEQVSRLASHVDPVLALLTPLWIAVPSPLTLAAVQIVAVGLGAFPVYWLARLYSGSEQAAGILALTYLVYPWTAWTSVDAFHPVTLAIPLLLFCLWFLETDRLLPFAVCAVLAAATAELMGIVVAGIGIWYAAARRRRLAGLVVAAAGTAWTLIAVYVVVPAFANGGPSPYYALYQSLGGSPAQVALTALTDPLAVLAELSRASDVLYIFLLAAPLGAVFVLAPPVAALALPQLGLNLLAGVGATTDPHEHYVAGVLPFLFAAAAVGLGRLSSGNRVRAATLALTLSLSASLMLGPWPGSVLRSSDWNRVPSTAGRTSALERAVGLVPDDAPVAATNFAGSHLADRRYLYNVPVVGRAQWIVLEPADTWVPQAAGGYQDPAAVLELRASLEESDEWSKVLDENGVLVFRKVGE